MSTIKLAECQRERDEWKKACEQNRQELEAWHSVAIAADVHKWNGHEYDKPEVWAMRVFARIVQNELEREELRVEVERLEGWKGSAMSLLAKYDAIAETFAGRLGSSKMANLARGISELRTELDELRNRLAELAALLPPALLTTLFQLNTSRAIASGHRICELIHGNAEKSE